MHLAGALPLSQRSVCCSKEQIWDKIKSTRRTQILSPDLSPVSRAPKCRNCFVAGELTALPRPPGEFKGLLRDREGKGGTRKKGFGRAHPFFVENTPTLYRARSRSFTKKFFVKLLDLALYKFTIQILIQTKIP